MPLLLIINTHRYLLAYASFLVHPKAPWWLTWFQLLSSAFWDHPISLALLSLGTLFTHLKPSGSLYNIQPLFLSTFSGSAWESRHSSPPLPDGDPQPIQDFFSHSTLALAAQFKDLLLRVSPPFLTPLHLVWEAFIQSGVGKNIVSNLIPSTSIAQSLHAPSRQRLLKLKS